jgi:hypothetical protein
MLLSCSKESNTLTVQIVSVTFDHLIGCISSETDPSDLMPLLKCFTKSLKMVGGPTALSQDLYNGIMTAIKQQLDAIADKRKNRSQRPDPEQVQHLGFMTMNFEHMNEDMETFALGDIERLLRYLDPKHPLLATVSSVRAMSSRDDGFNLTAVDDIIARLRIPISS